jgi:hypothetical protein
VHGIPEAARNGDAMSRGLRAAGFPEQEVRVRARIAAASVFPDGEDYGKALFGAPGGARSDVIDSAVLVPPVFMPERLARLIELGREPSHEDVVLTTIIGGFNSPLPLFVCAFGSTRVASTGLSITVSRQAGRLGIPMVIGENIVPVNGYGLRRDASYSTLKERISAYSDGLPEGLGGLVVQQSTEDADAEVWNLVYSDPSSLPLRRTGRLAFELKLGQGAKPGLGGMTMVGSGEAARLSQRYGTAKILKEDASALRWATPGTFTEEILRQQVRLMRNNFPMARPWVKLPPGRDVREAAHVAWDAGADAVTVDGGEAGSGWAPRPFLEHVGLPLGECLARIGRQPQCLLVSGRVWEGTRAVKCLAMGARAVGLGRAALLAADTDADSGLVNLVSSIELEMKLLISALGKYTADSLDGDDLWFPPGKRSEPQSAEPLAVRGQ